MMYKSHEDIVVELKAFHKAHNPVSALVEIK